MCFVHEQSQGSTSQGANCRPNQLCVLLILDPKPCYRLAAEHEDPVALQEAILEEEKGRGPFAWIANKIPASVHNNKIWRTFFWVRCLRQLQCHLHESRTPSRSGAQHVRPAAQHMQTGISDPQRVSCTADVC